MRRSLLNESSHYLQINSVYDMNTITLRPLIVGDREERQWGNGVAGGISVHEI